MPRSCYLPGFPIHVTIGVAKRRPVFEAIQLARPVFELVAGAEETLAACLMPEHLHWLLRDAAEALDRVRAMKSLTTRLGWRSGVRGRLWQRSFHDRVLRRDEDVLAVARYLAANPVRAGLVENVEAYPFQVIHADRIAEISRG